MPDQETTSAPQAVSFQADIKPLFRASDRAAMQKARRVRDSVLHLELINYKNKERAMAKVLYTAKALVTGGRDCHGRSADGGLEVDLRVPKEMGGTGGGTNPEELFAVGYAACFESALGGVARRRKLEIGAVTIQSSAGLLPTGDGGFKLTVALDVALPAGVDRQVAAELVHAATESVLTPMPRGATSTSSFSSTASRSDATAGRTVRPGFCSPEWHKCRSPSAPQLNRWFRVNRGRRSPQVNTDAADTCLTAAHATEAAASAESAGAV